MKISWEEYFMNICDQLKLRSPDPKTKVGSILVSKNNRILSAGFNGLPAGCDENIDWADRELVRSLIIHSEVNTILYSQSRYENATLLTSLSPCVDCIKIIAAANIKKIIYKDEFRDLEKVNILCKRFGIEMIKMKNQSSKSNNIYFEIINNCKRYFQKLIN